MVKTIITLIALLLATTAFTADYDGLLPGSNELNPAHTIAYAVTPAAVAVSSITPTRIDSAVNSALSAAIGVNYKRAEVQVQILDAAAMNCGYSTAISTASGGGFRYAVSADPVSHKIGKAIAIYCQGIASTSTVIVGGLGYK